MSLFEFSDISKSEETIQRTWEDFRSALATGVFSYNELDAAKANTTFLKVFDDLFSHCHVVLYPNHAARTNDARQTRGCRCIFVKRDK